jgi:molybdopterin-synthase adenylyltransferase
MDIEERYVRNLGTIGADGQRKLLDSSAAIVGLGGLGGHVLESLARVGVGRIVGIDPDTFEASNLNRQLLARTDNLGRRKVDEAAARLKQINPGVAFTGHASPVEEVGDEILADCAIIFDCLDTIPARRELARRCAALGLTLIHGAIAGWSGQIAVCRPGSSVLGKLYPGEKHGIEPRLGSLPFTAAVAAHVMVARAVTVLLEQESPESNTILFFDLQANEWQTVEL